MSSSARKRRFLGIAVLAATTASLALVPGAGGAGAQETDAEQLLPDLKTRRPSEVEIEPKSVNGEHKLLRFTNEIVNQGAGPLEVPTGGECAGQDPETHRLASQNIYSDTNGDGDYDADVDEVGTTEVVGCTEYHPIHEHWHLQDFALYELRAFRPNGGVGALVADSAKVGFCLVDTIHRKPHLPSSPATRVYNQSCKEDGLTGISIGWSDVYRSNLPHQWIEIDGVPPGTYCLRSVADPFGKLRESNDNNNRRGLKVTLYRRSVDYTPRRACIAPS